jgi:hypothetical protein
MRLKSALVLTFAFVVFTGFGGALTGSTNSLTATPLAASAFAGTWQTTWKNADESSGWAPVTIKADSQDANALDGVIEMKGPNGVMYGKLSTDSKTYAGDWWNSKGEKGTFTFTLKGTKSFEGSYTLEGTPGNFIWNGTK